MSETKNVVIQQNNGTDYNKIYPEVYDKNVNLSTENASVWGNTLEDALPKINSRLLKTEGDNWEIGDVKISAKESLGDKWLKADGSPFSAKDYPDLSNVCFFAGFPFGTQTITTSTVPGCAYFGRALNETNLKSPCSNYVNRYHFRFLFSRKVTEQGETEDTHIMTYYYSPDLINWKSNQIEIEPPAGTETVQTSFSSYFNGLGYENGYWYFSFQFDSDDALFFYYGQDLAKRSWTKVEINDSIVYDTNGDRYTFGCWGGEIFYKDNQWHTFVGLDGRYTTTYCIAEIISNDINFSSPSWQYFSEYFPENIYSSGRKNSLSPPWVFRIDNYIHIIYFTVKYGTSSSSTKGYYYCGGVIGSTRNTLTKLLGNSSSYTVYPQQTIKLSSGEVYFMYYRNTEQFYVKLTSNGISTAESYSKPVTFIKEDGTYIDYEQDPQYVYLYVYTSNNPTMSNYTEERIDTSKIVGYKSGFIGNAIFPDRVSYFQNKNDVNPNSVAELQFGGLLPNYTPESSSLTKLNAFIKALN